MTRPRRRTPIDRTLIFVLIALPLVFLSLRCHGDDNLYVSWQPLEPDKCIAAWLIKTYVNTNAQFDFLERGAEITNGVPFDVPGSRYVRSHRRSASEAVTDIHRINDPRAFALADIARRLDIGFWHSTFSVEEKALANKLIHLSTSPTSSARSLLDEVLAILDQWHVQGP